jgi:ELWxxDGT repeat protein
MVNDIYPGTDAYGTPHSSAPVHLTNVNGTLFFTALDGTHGNELWKSDGTATGTVLVKDILPGPGFSNPDQLTNVNGRLFFSAFEGHSLYESDGTAAGTVLVKDFANVSNLTNVNNRLFFSADDGKKGEELWTSDGTARGTTMVKDIYPGSTVYHGPRYTFKTPNNSQPANLTNLNGTLYFVANDGTHGRELWKSDGTATGTVLVKDINTGTLGSSPCNLTNVNGTLFFGASDGTSGQELWKSNGTASGTVLVKNIYPGTDAYGRPLSSNPASLTNASGTLYFAATDGTHGTELWQSDGTAAGTVLVKDINPGSSGSSPESLTVAGAHLFFAADDGVHGVELWDPQILPAAGTDTVQAPQGIRNSGDTMLLSDMSDGDNARAGLWSMPGTPWRGGPDRTHPLADAPGVSAPARANDNRPTHMLEQIFADVATHARRSRSGVALNGLWNPDLPEDWAYSCQLR